MSAKKRIVLQPEYVKNFVCDGVICEDNCCQGRWTIVVDEEHYKKIKKVYNKELEEKIGKHIKRNRSNSSKDNYGRIHQDSESNQCVFLTEDKLCELQMKLGADYLCDVCTAYPRYINLIDGKYERSLTVSCPLVGKGALLNKEPMSFEQIEETKSVRILVTKQKFDTEGHLFLNKPQRYFWDIRIFAISLLQNRNYTLGDRLIILGIIYKKIEELHEEKRASEIPSILETMETMIADGVFKEQLEDIKPNTQIQVQMTKAMIDRKIIQGNLGQRYVECFTEMLDGICYTGEESLEEVIGRYDYNYNEYYTPYIKEKEYILENYLVNEYFKEMMPFGSYKTIWESYVFLCVLYSMTKLHLIGMSGLHKRLNDDLTLKLIQSLSKEIIHNPPYIQGVISSIKESGYDSLAYMSILVKN